VAPRPALDDPTGDAELIRDTRRTLQQRERQAPAVAHEGHVMARAGGAAGAEPGAPRTRGRRAGGLLGGVLRAERRRAGNLAGGRSRSDEEQGNGDAGAQSGEQFPH